MGATNGISARMQQVVRAWEEYILGGKGVIAPKLQEPCLVRQPSPSRSRAARAARGQPATLVYARLMHLLLLAVIKTPDAGTAEDDAFNPSLFAPADKFRRVWDIRQPPAFVDVGDGQMRCFDLDVWSALEYWKPAVIQSCKCWWVGTSQGDTLATFSGERTERCFELVEVQSESVSNAMPLNAHHVGSQCSPSLDGAAGPLVAAVLLLLRFAQVQQALSKTMASATPARPLNLSCKAACLSPTQRACIAGVMAPPVPYVPLRDLPKPVVLSEATMKT